MKKLLVLLVLVGCTKEGNFPAPEPAPYTPEVPQVVAPEPDVRVETPPIMPTPVVPVPPAPVVAPVALSPELVQVPTQAPAPAPEPIVRVCTPRYFLVVETRMHSVSLNPFRYMRNKMNATQIKVPTDERGYNEAVVGQELASQFDNLGLLRGHVQEVRTIVVDKQTVCDL